MKGHKEVSKGLKDLIRNFEDLEKIGSIKKSARIRVKSKNNAKVLLREYAKFSENIFKKVKESHAYAMGQVAIKLKKALDDALLSQGWNWIDGTRDIVSSGDLMESGRVEYDEASDQISIQYDNDYAGIVHYGGYIKSGYNANVQIFYPARPWIDSVLEGGNGIQAFDFGGEYEKAFTRFFES